MSADKHTSGPWSVAQEIFDNDGAPEIVIERAFTNDMRLVVAVAIGGLVGHEANARLIAAAPELLEFAQEVRRSGDTRLASMAIAVINRATGGQP